MYDHLRELGWLLAVISLAALLGTVAWVASRPTTPAVPRCPAEDSCTVDYHDGAWYVNHTKVTR